MEPENLFRGDITRWYQQDGVLDDSIDPYERIQKVILFVQNFEYSNLSQTELLDYAKYICTKNETLKETDAKRKWETVFFQNQLCQQVFACYWTNEKNVSNQLHLEILKILEYLKEESQFAKRKLLERTFSDEEKSFLMGTYVDKVVPSELPNGSWLFTKLQQLEQEKSKLQTMTETSNRLAWEDEYDMSTSFRETVDSDPYIFSHDPDLVNTDLETARFLSDLDSQRLEKQRQRDLQVQYDAELARRFQEDLDEEV